ncbi:MAG: hypothetical protein IT178_10735 [Acidobacteria bacterium]|nr:hypothetical protein [Acidobacteriota bacterium]
MIDEPTRDDSGEPAVDELRDLTLPVDEGFAGRVSRRIERRLLAGDLIELAWSAPLSAALTLLRVPFEWFDSHGPTTRPDRAEPPADSD